MSLLGFDCPLPALTALAAWHWGGDGLQPAISVLSFVLCMVLAVSYVIPQSGLLAQVSSLWLRTGRSGLILKKHCSPHLLRLLPCPRLLVSDAGICAAFPLGELLLGL